VDVVFCEAHVRMHTHNTTPPICTHTHTHTHSIQFIKFHLNTPQGVLCDMLTGEEQLFGSGSPDVPANHLSCTVEMANCTGNEICT